MLFQLQLYTLKKRIGAGKMQHAPRAQFGNARVVQRVLRGFCVRTAKTARAQQNPAEIPRHDAQHVLHALAFEYVQNRLAGCALRLAVIAVALLAGMQDVGPAVVPGVIFPLLDGLELRPGLRLGRHGEDETEKAGFFFDIFRISLPRGDPELLHQTSSVTY